MTLRILKAQQAERDLLEIWVYIAEQSSVETAVRTLKDIQDYMDVLGDMPLAGRSREELLPGLRSFVAGKYVIYYRRVEEGVLIMRVLHGARQIEYLFPESLNDCD